jgi:hypothetical protein
MVTLEALKLLYAKLGGTDDIENITAISDMVDLIEDVAESGGGSSLPEVTADDNGDVLTVVSGEWAKAAPSGGGLNWTILFDQDITLTYHEGNPQSMTDLTVGKYEGSPIDVENYLNRVIFDGVSLTTVYSLDSPLEGYIPDTDWHVSIIVSSSDNLTVSVGSGSAMPDSDLETYCQTPKHLTIKYL